MVPSALQGTATLVGPIQGSRLSPFPRLFVLPLQPSQLIESGVPNFPCAYLEVGSKVRIEAGALRGLEGTLTELKGKRRLVLSITLLQRSVAVEIDSDAVSVVQALQRARP